MQDKRKHKDPLLYIHQPDVKRRGAHMQRGYVTPREESRIEGRRKKPRTIRKSSYFKSLHLDESDKLDSDDEVDESEEKPESIDRPPRDKRFKDMSLEEKVYYFAYAPATSPTLRCEIMTNERSFRGNIVDFIDDEVYMRVGRRISPEKIPFENIQDIRLLGF